LRVKREATWVWVIVKPIQKWKALIDPQRIKYQAYVGSMAREKGDTNMVLDLFEIIVQKPTVKGGVFV